MIEMKQLQYFLVCVETGSISKAAERLYTTQPNVSKIIRIMENQLGIVLFERKGRGIVPTLEGERVYQYAKPILQNAEYIQTMVRSHAYSQFNVASMPSNFLATVFAEYYNVQSDSEIKYRFREGSAEEVIHRVEVRSSELGFVYMQERQMPSFQYLLARKHLDYKELRKGKLVVYLGRKNPYFEENEITEEMLCNLHFIKTDEDAYGIDTELGNYFKNGRLKKRLENALVTNSDHVTMQLLLKTECAHISMKFEGEENENNGIRGIPIAGAGGVTFGYVKCQKEELGREARKFLECLEEEM